MKTLVLLSRLSELTSHSTGRSGIEGGTSVPDTTGKELGGCEPWASQEAERRVLMSAQSPRGPWTFADGPPFISCRAQARREEGNSRQLQLYQKNYRKISL